MYGRKDKFDEGVTEVGREGGKMPVPSRKNQRRAGNAPANTKIAASIGRGRGKGGRKA